MRKLLLTSYAPSTTLVVSGLNENGRRVKLEVDDYLARIFQHEIDHLNGVLFTDRAVKESLHWLTDEEESERKTEGKRGRKPAAALEEE